MPTVRTRRTRGRSLEAISPDAIAAWQAGDFWRLHSALGLRVWQMPDWNANPPETDDRPEGLRTAYPAPDVVALKVRLLEVGGRPGRWFYDPRHDRIGPRGELLSRAD